MSRDKAQSLRVTLDTSALRRDPRMKGGGVEALARWAETNYVTIYLSEVVVREFQTAPLTAVGGFAAARRALSEVKRFLPDEGQSRIELLETQIVAEFATIDAVASAEFARWLHRTNASILKVQDVHCRRVLDGYFAGAPPFRAPKAREDFPDAFVLECMRDLATAGELFVVTSDRRLALAAGTLPNVTVFTDVAALVKAPPFARLRNELLHAYEKENISAVLDALQAYKHKLEGRMAKALGTAVEGLSITPADVDSEAAELSLSVDETGAILQWGVDGSTATYLGKGLLSVRFVAGIDATFAQLMGNDLGGEDHTANGTLSVAGSLTLILDERELRRRPFYGIALGLLDHARVEIDTVDELEIEEKEW